MELGSWSTPASGFPSEWQDSEVDKPPFEHDGQYWFIAKEGFYTAQIRGPFPNEADAYEHWRSFWSWQSSMDAG